jgi:hypothetical protein
LAAGSTRISRRAAEMFGGDCLINRFVMFSFQDFRKVSKLAFFRAVRLKFQAASLDVFPN